MKNMSIFEEEVLVLGKGSTLFEAYEEREQESIYKSRNRYE
jgi:hypothetical protein